MATTITINIYGAFMVCQRLRALCVLFPTTTHFTDKEQEAVEAHNSWESLGQWRS